MADVPYNVDCEISSLISTGLRVNTLTGIILHLLTRHFASESLIADPRLKRFLWRPDITASKILIIPIFEWETQQVQQRPALTVKRNAIRSDKLAIGDGLALNAPPSLSQIPSNVPPTLQIGFRGSHTVFAISTKPMEAELLAAEVATRLSQYAQVITREFNFHEFRLEEIGEVARMEEHVENFVVPVTVAYTYIDAWQLVSAAPFLSRIALGIATED